MGEGAGHSRGREGAVSRWGRPPRAELHGAQLFDEKTKWPHNNWFRSEGFPSGQRDQTVNLTALPSKVRILPPPPIRKAAGTASVSFVRIAGVAQW